MDEEMDWYRGNVQATLEGALLGPGELPLPEDRFEDAFANVLRRLREMPGVPAGRDPIVDALREALLDMRFAVETAADGESFRSGRTAYLKLFN